MGDILGLIEKAEEFVDKDQAEQAVRRILRNEFTLEDYRAQLAQVRKMGPLQQVLSMIPGLGNMAKDVDAEAGERELKRTSAIIDSMTARERRDQSVLNGSRRRRIAKGSGTTVEDVNRVLKNYVQARKLMKQMGGGARMMKKLGLKLPVQ
jgi:signal recognition particle subunit SRP54